NRGYVGGVQRVIAIVPVLPAKRADRQIEFHLIVELPIPAEDFHLSAAGGVPRYADARCKFVSPAEIDRMTGSARWLILSRQIFSFEAETSVDGESPGNRPGVLYEEGVIVADGFPERSNVLDTDVAILAGARAVQRYKGRAIG